MPSMKYDGRIFKIDEGCPVEAYNSTIESNAFLHSKRALPQLMGLDYPIPHCWWGVTIKYFRNFLFWNDFLNSWLGSFVNAKKLLN